MIQTNNNDRWGSLSMQERAQLLGIYASKGYTDLAKIISHYNSFATGGHLYQGGGPDNPPSLYKPLTVAGTTPETSDNTRYVRPISDVEIDRTSGLPEGTTTMRRIIAAQADRQQPVIKQDTATSETHKSRNKEVKKAQVAKKVNDVSNAVAAVTSIPATIVAPEVMTPIFALHGFNDATDVLSKDGSLNKEDYGRLGFDALFMLPMFNTAGNYLRFNTNLGRGYELSKALNKSIRNTELSQSMIENPANNRFRLGDVEIDNPSTFYRQGNGPLAEDLIESGIIRTKDTGEKRIIGTLNLTKPVQSNAMFNKGRVAFDPESNMGKNLVTTSSSDKMIYTQPRTWTGSDVYINNWQTNPITIQEASAYVYEPNYGYRRVQEPIPTLEQAYQEAMMEKYPLALSHNISNNHLKSTLLGRHKSLLNPSTGLGHMKYNSEIDNHTTLFFDKDMLNNSYTSYLGDGNTPMVYEFFDNNEHISRYSARKINQRMRSKSGIPLSKLGAGEQISLEDAIRIARENVAKSDNFNTYNELKFNGLVPVKKAGYGFTDSEEIADMLHRRGIITNFDFYTSDPRAYSNYEDFLKNVVFKNPDYKFRKGGKIK